MDKRELEDSWAYQNLLQEGHEEGRDAWRATLIDYLDVRYPMLVDLAKQQTRLIKDISVLQQAVIKGSAF